MELGQELEVKVWDQRDAGEDRERAAGHHPQRTRERPPERALVPGTERTHEPRRLLVACHRPREQRERKRRRHGECDDERGEGREHVGSRERAEECPLEPAEQEDRQEDERDHDRGVHDRAPDLHARGEDDLACGGARGRRAEPAPDILDVDDGIVHHLAHGDREPTQHHRVERRAGRAQYRDCGEQRERYCHHAHERGPEVAKEEKEDDEDQHRACEKGEA